MRIRVNGEERDLDEGRTVRGLLELLGLASEQVAVERNGEVVPRASHAQTVLAEGDEVEVVTLVGGG